VCKYIRIVPAIEESKSIFFFWSLYGFACVVIISLICAFVYIGYCVSRNRFYFTWPIYYLREALLIVYWILFAPFSEVYFAIFKCENGNHKIHTSLQCYNELHIFLIVLSMIFFVSLMILMAAAFFFLTKIIPNEDDSSARLEDEGSLFLIVFRLVLSICTIFTFNVSLTLTIDYWELGDSYFLSYGKLLRSLQVHSADSLL